MNWLLVSKWEKDKDNVSMPTSMWKMTRRVEAIGKKAKKLAEQYERELNGGLTARERWEKGDFSLAYSVCPITWEMAREYRSIKKWENSPFYKPRKEKG